MRSLFVSAALTLMVGGATAAAQTPTPASSTASAQAPAPSGQTSNVTPPTISAGPPYRLDLSGDANITGTYRVNGVPISATSNWTQAGNSVYYTTGTVGIGTPSPAHTLDVNGTTALGAPGGVYGFSIASLYPGPYPTVGFNAFYTGSGYLAGALGYGGVFQFQDGNGLFGYYNTSSSVIAGAPHTLAARLTIDKDGDVMIGTAYPGNAKVTVNSTGLDHAVFAVNTGGGSGVIGSSNNANGVFGLSDTGDGVSGTSGSGYGVFGQSLSGWSGYFTGNVNVTGVVCATNVGCASDSGLKQDVAPLSYGLREVLRLRAVRWQWKDPAATQLNFGLVAQDVEPVLPELILRNVDTKGALGLNYYGFIPVLINAIQEQQDTITALKAENASLDTRIRALEQAMQQLRKRD